MFIVIDDKSIRSGEAFMTTVGCDFHPAGNKFSEPLIPRGIRPAVFDAKACDAVVIAPGGPEALIRAVKRALKKHAK